MSRRLMITVDVEAQPPRATQDHVERLIFGRWPDARPGGIIELMAAAERNGARLVMFFDFTEEYEYGQPIRDAAKLIHDQGHDLQLHAHPVFVPDSFWEARGAEGFALLDRATALQANALFEDLSRQYYEITGKLPLAFRGGGYRYNANILGALTNNGVRLDSSYIATRNNQPFPLGLMSQFRWANGPYELPVSTIPFDGEQLQEFNFNSKAFPDAQRMLDYLDAFYAKMGDDAVATLVMHSWSLSEQQEDRIFGPPAGELVERFDQFLAGIRGSVQVITSPEFLQLVDTGSIPTARTVSIVRKRWPVVQEASRPRPSAPGARRAVQCTVCGAPESAFHDPELNNKNGRRCPSCGALERQRVLPVIYDEFLAEEFPLQQKRVLAVAPSASELLFYEQRGIASIVTCDVRPDGRPDLQVDVCAMPEVPSKSFDAIVASYVFTCVHDLDGAMKEFHRVLKPGGRLLTSDPLTANHDTVEFEDPQRITGWYGQEAYDTYKIGSFRKLGDRGLLGMLQRRFLCKTFYGRDPITGSTVVWVSSERR
jgi:SAM-dependent methyltransferase